MSVSGSSPGAGGIDARHSFEHHIRWDTILLVVGVVLMVWRLSAVESESDQDDGDGGSVMFS